MAGIGELCLAVSRRMWLEEISVSNDDKQHPIDRRCIFNPTVNAESLTPIEVIAHHFFCVVDNAMELSKLVVGHQLVPTNYLGAGKYSAKEIVKIRRDK